jgi:hypothetical protein
MRFAGALAWLVLVFGAATGAWAQYGLSGAPELLRLGPEAGPPGLLPAYPADATGAAYGGDSRAAYPGWQGPTSGPPSAFPSARLTAWSGSPRTSSPTPAPAPGLSLGPIPDAASAASPSVMNLMLEESGDWSAPGIAGPGCGPGQACGGPCGPCFEPQWYVSAAGLIMTRDKANCLWTTYESDNNPNQIMRFNDARVDWRGGFEVRIGRRFGGCGQWAVEADYWRIDGFGGFASASITDWTVSTPLIVDEIEFGGVPGTMYFDGAAVHRIWRSNQFQNVEINLVRNPIGPDGCSPVDLHWLLGVRWFNFDESLVFGTETLTPEYAYLSDKIRNNLIGVQVGLNAGYRLGYNWRLYAEPKVGLYDNHIENTFDAFRADGVHAVPTAASGVPGEFPVSARKDQFAVLTQIDVGLDWQFHPQWRAFVGYRLIAATGVGLADHQFITYVVDLPEYERIKSNGNLLLHGGFAGLEFRF